MAADHWSIEYHLTAEGGVSGTSKTFGKVDGAEVPRPATTGTLAEAEIRQETLRVKGWVAV